VVPAGGIDAGYGGMATSPRVRPALLVAGAMIASVTAGTLLSWRSGRGEHAGDR
jgi:hypothetical protein